MSIKLPDNLFFSKHDEDFAFAIDRYVDSYNYALRSLPSPNVDLYAYSKLHYAVQWYYGGKIIDKYTEFKAHGYDTIRGVMMKVALEKIQIYRTDSFIQDYLDKKGKL